MASSGMQKMREFSATLAETEELDRCEKESKTLTWAASVRGNSLTSGRETQKKRRSWHHDTVVPDRRPSTAPHRLIDGSMSPFRWLPARDPMSPFRSDVVQTESWTSFHAKYSSKKYRTANMNFFEIEEQQRRERKPSLCGRITNCFRRRSDQCDCGMPSRCDGFCNRDSPSKKQMSPFRRKQKRSL